MANIRVTIDNNPNNARSESNLAINPNNPQQIVGASKKFANIQTYNFTLATVYSEDGGKTWHDSAALAMAGFTVMTDPTLAWDDIGNVYGTTSLAGPGGYGTIFELQTLRLSGQFTGTIAPIIARSSRP